MKNSLPMDELKFYDGRIHSIDRNRLFKFDMRSIIDRYYSGQNIDSATIFEDIGPVAIDYSNVQHWSNEIPDLNSKGARVFTLWAEGEKTKEVIVILRGFYILIPFKLGEQTVKEYYIGGETGPYYPVAVISSFRTIYSNELQLNKLVDRVKEEIQLNWQKIRQELLERLDKTELWKRYVLSFEQIIHYSFLVPGIDRELIEALRRQNYRTTGVFQLLSSPTTSYDQAMINSHLKEAKIIMENSES